MLEIDEYLDSFFEGETIPRDTTHEDEAPREYGMANDSETLLEARVIVPVDDTNLPSTSTAEIGYKSSNGTKPCKARKTFEERQARRANRINKETKSTFLAFLRIGRNLRFVAADFIENGKTMKERDEWVIANCGINNSTASKLRRMSELYHVTHRSLLKVVNMRYLQTLNYTILYDLSVAWEATKKGCTEKNGVELTWNSNGIFAKFSNEVEAIDVRKLSTRKVEKKLKLVGSSDGAREMATGNEKNKNETSPRVNELSDDISMSESNYAVLAANLKRQRDDYLQQKNEALLREEKLKTEHEATLKAHLKREQELLNELEAAKKRADELAAELEQLRAQTSVERVAV